MKRLWSIVCVMALVLLSCPTAYAANAASDFTYTVLANNTASVKAYVGTATEVTVPDTLGGYTVTVIGVNAFAGKAVTSVTLPDSVKTIDECAFESCASLTSITLGAALQTVGYYAFHGCSMLTDVYFNGTAGQFEAISVMGGNDVFRDAQVHLSETQAQTISLLPDSASAFSGVSAGGGNISVSRLSTGEYQFSSNGGWPHAVTSKSTSQYVSVMVNEDVYLNYDFTVKTGETNIVVYFNGASPLESALGTWVSLNGLVDPYYVDYDGTVYDLGPGHYTGSVKVSELGYRSDMLIGNMLLLSDVKVFAVGGTTVITELSVGEPKYLPEPPPDAQYLTSLLPTLETDFCTVEKGEGEVYVSSDGEGGFHFESWWGWPYAYTARNESEWVWADTTKEQYLYYDFTVHYGATNVLVFFGGQDPNASSFPAGSYASLNPLIDASLQGADGTVYDLGFGTYRGKIPVSELGCAASLMQNGRFALSGIKIFAVAGWVEVNELALYTPPAEETTLRGDLTGDGLLNMMDALLLYTGVSYGTLTAADAEVADFNRDGIMNMMDALLLYTTVSN